MLSFVKIKFSRICKITLSFIDIGKSRPCCEFSTSQIYVLTLFSKIEFSEKYPNLQYFTQGSYKLKYVLQGIINPGKMKKKVPFAY